MCKPFADPALVASPAGATAADGAPRSDLPASLARDLHAAFGEHRARTLHAEWVVPQGGFAAEAGAKNPSCAAVFRGPSPVAVRFSDSTGLPEITDVGGTAIPRGFAPRRRRPGRPFPGLPDGGGTEELRARIARGPVRSTRCAQLAAPGGRVDDPPTAWPDSRTLVQLGVVTLDRPGPDTAEADRALLFPPGSLPPGIGNANPMVTVRNAAYPISFHERQ